MSFLQDAWRFLTLQSSPPPPQIREAISVRPISSTLNQPIWPKRDVTVYTEQAYAKLALIFRCVGILSQSIAQAPLRVYMDAPDGEKDIDKHPLRQLLIRPNRETNEARFLGQVMMTMSIAGFCVIEKERAAAGRVVGLWPINPAYCKPIPRSDALPDWEIRVPGYEPVILSSENCIAVTFADKPDQSATGISPIEVILREVSLLNLQTDFLKAFFDAGAMPVYALIPRAEAGTMSQAEADVIREKWRQRYGGMHAAVEPAILAGIEDVRRLSFDFDELAYTDLRDLSDNAICQAFGVHPNLAGTRYGLERSTFTNYKEARSAFYEDTVSHFWNRIEDALYRGLMHEFDQRPGIRLAFDTSDVAAMREDVLPRWQWAVTALSAGGITTHQFARLCDLDPVGQDVFLRSFATVEVPLNGVKPPPAAKIAPADDDEEDGGALLALPDKARSRDRGMEKRAAIGQTSRAAYLRIAEAHEPHIARYLDEQKARVVSNTVRSVDAIPEYLKRDCVRIAANAKRDGVTNALIAKALNEALETRDVANIDWSEEERLLQQIIQALQMNAGEVAFALASQTTGVGSLVWTTSNPNIMRLIDALAKRVVEITDTTRRDIARVVTESLTEGVTMEQLRDNLTGLYDETYNGRSMTIARTESQVAYNEAAALGYSETGVIDQIQLLDNPMHDTDPGTDGWTCAQRNGQIVPLRDASKHISAEHPNGTLAIAPYITAGL